MSLIEVKKRAFEVSDMSIPVEWASYDFEDDVSGIPIAAAREILVQTGVMYVSADSPQIRVSHLLSNDLQGLSALHEEMCMNQKTADCPEVEEMVIDSIDDLSIQNDFVASRLQMFGALCMIYSNNEQFEATRQVLYDRTK
jgi:hypothetical protein